MIIDGKAIAAKRLASLKLKVQSLTRPPKLAIVLIGDDPASKIYVSLKIKKAKEIGIETEVRQDLNTDADGIIVQIPGPQELIDRIPLEKDVDGLRENSPFLPATVKGILTILQDVIPAKAGIYIDSGSALRLSGMTFCVVGQGKLVGKPLSDYLEKNNCKVIRCDEFTKDLKTETLKGDVLVSATGVEHLIKADMVKNGAVVIDCGSPKAEVDPAAAEVASVMTPVPGGVGPLTVVSLLENTVQAAYNATAYGN